MAKEPRPSLRFVDRLVLLVAWLVTCGLVYVLGYYVGKGTLDSRHAALEERAVRLPVSSTPPPEGQRPKEAKEFPTFYQALPAGERPIDVARGATVTAPPAPAQPAAPTTTPPVTTTPPPTLPRATTATLPAGQPAAAHPASATSTTLVRTTPPPAPPPTRPAIAPTPATPPATAVVPGAAVPPPTTPPRTAARGGFTVEASPTRSRSEAEQLLATLRRRGYDATIVQVQRDGDVWYRLRLGRYATSEQATEAMRRLRDVEGVTHVFVAAE